MLAVFKPYCQVERQTLLQGKHLEQRYASKDNNTCRELSAYIPKAFAPRVAADPFGRIQHMKTHIFSHGHLMVYHEILLSQNTQDNGLL